MAPYKTRPSQSMSVVGVNDYRGLYINKIYLASLSDWWEESGVVDVTYQGA